MIEFNARIDMVELIIGFNITKTYDKLVSGKGNRDSIYDCTRHYWANVKIEKAELADYVFGVAHCKVVGVFKPHRWYYTEPGKIVHISVLTCQNTSRVYRTL